MCIFLKDLLARHLTRAMCSCIWPSHPGLGYMQCITLDEGKSVLCRYWCNDNVRDLWECLNWRWCQIHIHYTSAVGDLPVWKWMWLSMGRQLTGAAQIHLCVSFFWEFSLLVLGNTHIQSHDLNTVRILGVDRITVVGWGNLVYRRC